MPVHTQHEAVLEPYGEQTWLELALAELLWGRYADLYAVKLFKIFIAFVFSVGWQSASLLQMFSVS